MGEVILYLAVSVDGFIAGKEDDLAWLDPFQAGGEDYGYTELVRNIGAMVMGARTYERVRMFPEWPENKDIPTYVVSRRNLPAVPGVDIRFYSGDLTQLAGKIRNDTGKNIWLLGGGLLAQSFLQENLVDQMILSTIPVLLGDGVPLFTKLPVRVKLAVLDSKTYASGIVQTHYRPLP